MKNLYESILRPDAIGTAVQQTVEVEAVLKKHRWFYKSYRWEGKTLKVIFDGRGYMDDFGAVAEELGCKSFDIYPWAIISGVKQLDGFEIKAATRLDITCNDIQNSSLTAGHCVTIFAPKKNEKVKLVRNDIHSGHFRLDGIDGATMVGNDFDEVDFLTLRKIGPKIEKIVLGWNLVTNYKDRWTTYPRPAGKPDPAMDPLKSLGLDKHFKNLTDFTVALTTGGNDDYITFSTRYKQKRHDWGIDELIDLDNGFQAKVVKDARCV